MQTVKHLDAYFGAINPLIVSVLETRDPLFVFEFETFRFESLNLKLFNSDPLVIEQRRGLKQDAHMRPLK